MPRPKGPKSLRIMNRMGEQIGEAEKRIEGLEIVVRAALSFVQERHPDHDDGHARMVIMALRGALAERERD